MLSNVLPLRLTVHPRMSLSELIEQVAEHVLRGLLHQRYRTEDLNRILGYWPMIRSCSALWSTSWRLTTNCSLPDIGPPRAIFQMAHCTIYRLLFMTDRTATNYGLTSTRTRRSTALMS